MTISPEQALYVSNLTLRILDNQNKGLPPHHGLTRDELKLAIEYARVDYSSNQGKSKAAGVSQPSGPMDLTALFTQKQSK